jgi:hypothetical protein
MLLRGRERESVSATGGRSSSRPPSLEHDDLAADDVAAAECFEVLVDVPEPDLRDIGRQEALKVK